MRTQPQTCFFVPAQDCRDVVPRLVAALGGSLPRVLLYFCPPDFPLDELARAVHEAFPESLTAGCMGGAMLGGRTGVSVLALGGDARAAADHIEDLNTWSFADGPGVVGSLAFQLGMPPARFDPARHLLLVLADGACQGDERLVAGVSTAAPRLPLVGGSAGSVGPNAGLVVALRGRAFSGGAVVMLIEPGVPFVTLAEHHFVEGAERVVVTGVGAGGREVHELDGRPALQRLSMLTGWSPVALRRHVVESGTPPVQFAVRVRDHLFVRACTGIEGDRLILASLVDEGMVLRLVRPRDLVKSTQQGLQRAALRIGQDVAGALLFNCLGRMLSARHDGELDRLEQALTARPVAGFHSVGEYYGAVKVSFTVCGVAFGRPDPGAGSV